MRLKLVPSDTSVNFLQHRRIAFVFSIVLVLSSIGLFLSKGLNLGIDFKAILLDFGSNPACAPAARMTPFR